MVALLESIEAAQGEEIRTGGVPGVYLDVWRGWGQENGSGVTCGRCEEKLGDRLNKGGKKKMCFGFMEFF